ncbi:uncharacterized protein LOC134815449 [Bolinopsis microptera]|uniref:uncharacterized protein LOC134815449 n=1 Tax=Bolinopsis microptera TaxID=2820187 RepID=UPI00307A5E27
MNLSANYSSPFRAWRQMYFASPERAAVMKRIGRGSVRILIASDVASRGIDIPGLDVVINGQLPVDSTGYLHRAGRTARMGNAGVVLNFLSNYDVPLYSAITDAMKKKVPNLNDTMRGPPNHEKRYEQLDTNDVNRRKQSYKLQGRRLDLKSEARPSSSCRVFVWWRCDMDFALFPVLVCQKD